VVQLVETMNYKQKVASSVESLEFFFDFILPTALWS